MGDAGADELAETVVRTGSRYQFCIRCTFDGFGSRVIRETSVFRFKFEERKPDLTGIVDGFGLVGLFALTDHHGSGEAGERSDDNDNDEQLHQGEAVTHSCV